MADDTTSDVNLPQSPLHTANCEELQHDEQNVPAAESPLPEAVVPIVPANISPAAPEDNLGELIPADPTIDSSTSDTPLARMIAKQISELRASPLGDTHEVMSLIDTLLL